MEWYHIVLLVILGINLLILILFPFILSFLLYQIHMVRTRKSKWDRNCSLPKNEEQLKMWNDGLDYISQYKENIKEVHITNDNLNLYGEFVDIGSKKCAIILGGRCESLYYSYYYAKPYLENNCNVLVIDQRAHGKSDGKINTVGFKESEDIIKWAEFLHNECGIEEIYMQGTCIGGATIIHAIANKNCPTYISKVVVDGLFTTYYETFKYHMIALNKPTWPCLDICFSFYKAFAKIDAKKVGPVTLIDKIDKDILFVSGLKDQYVSKEDTMLLFDKCSSKNKDVVFLPEGGHSHLRINQIDKYDEVIINFINK